MAFTFGFHESDGADAGAAEPEQGIPLQAAKQINLTQLVCCETYAARAPS